jgi:hypothetical protein
VAPPNDQDKIQGKFAREKRPIRLADSTLGHRAHICAFFNNPEDEYKVLLPDHAQDASAFFGRIGQDGGQARHSVHARDSSPGPTSRAIAPCAD